MMDGDGNFALTATKELEEECGIKIDPQELTELTSDIPGQLHGLSTSGGLLDETIKLFYCHKHLDDEQASKLEGRIGGLREHGERINVTLVDFDKLLTKTSDMKV